MTQATDGLTQLPDELRSSDVERFKRTLAHEPDPDHAVDKVIATERQSAQDDAGHVNVVVLGNSGVGKSTLIDAMFRAPIAQTGAGRPVTDTITQFDHPELPLTVYDTPGLTLADDSDRLIADVVELARKCAIRGVAAQLHIAWFCFNAQATRIEDPEYDTVRELTEILDVIVVATKCPDPDDPQLLSLLDAAQLEALPIAGEGVVRTLAAPMRIGSHVVLPYGLDELAKLTLELLPDVTKRAFASALRDADAFLDLKAEEARRVVAAAGVAAGAIGVTPVPFPDALVLVPIQIGMLTRINAIFGVNFHDSELEDLMMRVLTGGAMTTVGRYTVQQLLKLIPFAGPVISGSVATSFTIALGIGYTATLVAILRARAEGRELPAEEVARMLKDAVSPFLGRRGADSAGAN